MRVQSAPLPADTSAVVWADIGNQPDRSNQMRTLQTIPALVLLALLLGCASTEDIAYKTTGTAVVTVDGAMKGWLDWKNTHTVPQDQIDAVKSAYAKYYATVQAEKDAVTAFKTNTDTNALNRAISLSAIAGSDLLQVILQFLPPNKAAELKGVR